MDRRGREAIAAYYSAYHDKLFIHACALTGDRELAEEAVQEAFLAACRKPEALTASVNPLGWLKKAVRFAALHLREDTRAARALSRSLEDLPEGEAPGRPDDRDEGLLERCLAAADREDVELFARIALGGWSFQEEAERLGISVAACYKRYERTRERLRRVFRGSGEN